MTLFSSSFEWAGRLGTVNTIVNIASSFRILHWNCCWNSSVSFFAPIFTEAVFDDKVFLIKLVTAPANNQNCMVDFTLWTDHFRLSVCLMIINYSLVIKFENRRGGTYLRNARAKSQITLYRMRGRQLICISCKFLIVLLSLWQLIALAVKALVFV